MAMARNATPRGVMILALVGFCIVSFLAYHWLTQPILTAADVTAFSGTVHNVRNVSGKNGYLEITLYGQSYPFRSFSPAIQFDAQGPLRPGVPASIGVAKSNVPSPSHNWIENQKFYELVTLDCAGVQVLDLSVHNRQVESNRRFGPWFCLAMALLCLWMFWLGFRNRGSNRPLPEIFRERRNAKKREPGTSADSIDRPTNI